MKELSLDWNGTHWRWGGEKVKGGRWRKRRGIDHELQVSTKDAFVKDPWLGMEGNGAGRGGRGMELWKGHELTA